MLAAAARGDVCRKLPPMSVDRPETATGTTTEPAGNGHDSEAPSGVDDSASESSSESPGDEPTDSTEPIASPPIFGEREPIVVPPAPAPAPPAPPVGGTDGVGPSLVPQVGPPPPLQPRQRRGASDGSEVRWVTHRLRHVSLWSVCKVAGLFYVCLFFSLLVATVLLWNVGRATGTVEDFESFISGMGSYGECVPEKTLKPGTEFERDEDCNKGSVRVGNFHFDGRVVFRTALFGGMVFVIAATAATLLLTILFNLLNDITGGVRYTLIREPGAGPPPPPLGRGRGARIRRVDA
jgi:hypothetical protein